MAPKRGLGRGLSNLIPTDDTTEDVSPKASKQTKTGAVTKTEVVKKVEQTLNINRIEPNKNQPRKEFNEDALQELADSIKQFGVIEPLVVVKRKGYYELIAGERRWRAARLAGLKEVPVVIKDYDDQQIVEIALIENIQREDLNPIEEAHAYERLIQEFNLTQDEVAERVSKSRTTVTNALRLLKLTEKVQQMLIDDMLSTGHVRALITIADPQLQYETAMYIFDKKHMWIRHVLVPGITTDEADLKKTAEFIRTLKTVDRVEVLPYHKLGIQEWERLGIPYKLEGIDPPTDEQQKIAREILDAK